MLIVFELSFIILITYLFIKKENPKIKFLVLGYLFFCLALILQIPIRFLEFKLQNFLSYPSLSILTLGLVGIIISELTKYFSLKKFLKTKSVKNGILFGIGWASLESLSSFSLVFYSIIFSSIGFTFAPTFLIEESFFILPFLFLFLVNIVTTLLVTLAIIKRKKIFISYAVLFAFAIFYGLYTLEELYKFLFSLIFVLYSFYILFHYRKLL